MLCVIGIVAPLTQGSQVAWVTVLGSMVEVCNRKDYLSLFASLGIKPHCVVLDSAELATVVCAFKD